MNPLEVADFVRDRIEDDRRKAHGMRMDYAGPEVEDFWRDLPNLDGGWQGTRVLSRSALIFAARYADHPDFDEEWRP